MAKTTSSFISDCTIRQYPHGSLLESPFVPSSTDCWAVRANGRLSGRRGETGSRNMAATQKINFLTLVSYSLLKTVFSWDVPFRHNTKRHRRQTTDGRHTVPKARPIVRSAKKRGIQLIHDDDAVSVGRWMNALCYAAAAARDHAV